MAIEIPEIKKYAGMFSHGLIIKIAPEIAKGILVTMFRAKKVDVKSASEWVRNNTSLWKSFEPKEQEMMKNLAEKVGNIDWLDSAWVIEAIRGDFPAVASLFVGPRKERNWLKRQVEIIKKEVGR